VSDDRAPISRDAWPGNFRPFESDATPEEREERPRLYDEKQVSLSVAAPERPESRKTPDKPASLNEKVFRLSDRKGTGKPPALASAPDILGRFKADLYRAGVAGEERLACLAYLALTSRVLPWGKAGERPISLLAKGTSSTGKSHTTGKVLEFFPESAWINLGSMSRRYLFYTEEDFAHRFLVVPEWSSVKDDDEVVAMLRVLLSEGRIVHGTVEGGDEGKRKAKRIEKKGPTGLLVTTTETAVDLELETRCLSVTTDDTPEQTRRVYSIIAGLEQAQDAVDFEPWHEFQTWISEQGEARVGLPFIEPLAALMPVGATRLRRDFVSLLCLIRAHAILYQAQRGRDEGGRIVATVEDYAAVRELVSDVIAEAADASVSVETRQTVEAVRVLVTETGTDHTSVKALTDRLAVGSSATYDRVRVALRGGYLVNRTDKGERGYKLAVGADMPGEDSFLPLPEEVFRSLSGYPTGKANPLEQRASGEFSGIPAIPVDPQKDEDGLPSEDEIERLAELSRHVQAAERGEL
jgi:hypothetical protein